VARVEQTANGAVLNVSVPDLPAPDGYYEVWMLAPDASSMISVGVLGGGEQNVFPLPAGMQLADFPVVDISVEKYDGDTGHSADSLVRGQLSN
jgi:anti-sigma-K factor RskA